MSGVRMLRVPAERAGQRLDNLLMGELKVPRTLVYRLIRKGQVRVNGGRVRPMHRLAAGDEIRIPPVRGEGRDAPAPTFSAGQLEAMRRRVIFRSAHYLVVDKPAGMAVHAGSGLRWGAIDVLRAAFPAEQSLELVHRLDRETSGCLLLARTRKGLLAAQAALRDGRMDKRYLCLVAGDAGQAPRTVDVPLTRNVERGGERMVVVDPAGGRPAVSHFTPLQHFGAWTLMQVSIETGRTHQIRVHAAHLGHPLAGDDRYGDGRAPPGLGRLFLHCTLLAFDAEEASLSLQVSAPLPDDLRAVLDALASESP